jgi:peptidoglycan/xylan/chitin deacetylase (PgdA/CDA1 family)
MYGMNPILGTSLPPMTLCLTFDDGPGETSGSGPGPHTLKLAEYLSAQGVPATFFMVGKHAEQFFSLPPRIRNLGHLVANHTYDHPQLVEFLAGGGDLIDQVSRADAVLRNSIDGPTIFFRAPYGTWSNDVALTLNNNLAVAMGHVGPILWDIDGGDWYHWKEGHSPQFAADVYLRAIQLAGRGIVLMHDSTADIDVVKQLNRTLSMIQILIPALKAQGYRFVRLDAVPDVVAAVQRPFEFALLASNGKYVSPQAGGDGSILVSGPAIGPWEKLGIVSLAPGKVALRAGNGLYFSPQNGGGGDVLANGQKISGWEPFDLISVGPRKVAFRTITGHFLTRGVGGVLKANVTWLRDREIFTFQQA